MRVKNACKITKIQACPRVNGNRLTLPSKITTLLFSGNPAVRDIIPDPWFCAPTSQWVCPYLNNDIYLVEVSNLNLFIN